MVELELTFPPESEMVAGVRHSLDALAAYVEPAKLEDFRLMVSELVTNSIRHAGLGSDDLIKLKVRVSSRHLHAEVQDSGGGFRTPVPMLEPNSSSGWGLYIVERLADEWGMDRDKNTHVWFQIGLSSMRGNHLKLGNFKNEAFAVVATLADCISTST